MFLISPYGWACTILAVIEASVLCGGIARNPLRSDALLFTTLLLASGTYDNLLVGWGSFLGEGKILTTLSYVRWFAHWAMVPFLIVVCLRIARNAGIKAANRDFVMPAAYVVSVFLAVMDVHKGFMGLELEPETFKGTLRLVSSGEELPLVTILVNVFVLIVYGVLWRRTGEYVAFFGSLAAIIGNAIPASMAGTLPGATGEALLFFGSLASNYIFWGGFGSDEESRPLIP